MRTVMHRSLAAVLVTGSFALSHLSTCLAATLEECVYPHPELDARTPGMDAVVTGTEGSRVAIHPVAPALCAAESDRLCRGKAYVLPGDHVQAARRCGTWVYAKYSGNTRSTIGWIDVGRLSSAPPDAVGSQIAVDVTSLPQCVHHWLWATHSGQFTAAPGQTIVIHARNPMLCTAPDAGLCGKVKLITAGPTTYYSEACGSWVYVSPRDQKSVAATGWVAASEVVPLTPPVQAPKPSPTPWPYEHDPLYKAVLADDSTEVRRLIAAGRKPNVPIDMGLPTGPYAFVILSTAIEQGKADMVKLLLSLGADPNLHDPPPRGSPSSCPLALAAEKAEVVSALISAGADVNCGKWGAPLKWAAGNLQPADLDVLKILIAAHAEVDIDGGAPLREAISRNNVEAAQLLLHAGANPNRVVERLVLAPPLSSAISHYEDHWDPAMIRVLLNAGADPNYRDPDNFDPSPRTGEVQGGETLLTLASGKGDLEVVNVLLQHGADPSRPRQDGLLPSAVAEKNGHLEVAALIEKFAAGHAHRASAGSLIKAASTPPHARSPASCWWRRASG